MEKSKEITEVVLEIGQIVCHKAGDGFYSIPRMVITRSLSEERVECRFWNDAQKKFTTQEFYRFELKKSK